MASEIPTLNCSETADVLVHAKEDILRSWEKEARENVDAAKKQSRLALRNSLPLFLDNLIATLRSEDPTSHAKSNAEVARAHAEDRANQPEYSLDEVIHEYHLLRKIILKRFADEGSISFECLIVTNEYIDRGIGKAATTYIEVENGRRAFHDAELERAKIEAERASQAKSSFLANMSHEIRTPLGAMMGFVGLLKDGETSPAETSKYLSIIERNSYHLLRIIDDILDLTKVEAGKMLIEKNQFSLVEMIADFSSIVGLKARDKGIVFEFSAKTLLPEFIISDSTRLRQILSNIVGNAIKFTDEGRVELAVSYSSNHLDFRVTDTGRGISSKQRTQLFQAFSQADSSTTRKFGGTGLGLVLTKKLCQALGGDFALISSEVGKGSTFAASIPVAVPASSTLVPLKEVRIGPLSKSQNDEVNLNGLEVLLVEDSPDNQFLVKAMLNKMGVEVTVANNGAEGLDMIAVHTYTVILMDIQMPVMDGHEATRTLRARGYKGPIVAFTAHAMKEERERAKQSGFSHFLSKPIDRKSLTDLLQLLKSPLDLRA